MKIVRAVPAILFLGGLLFAYGCDCEITNGPANGSACVLNAAGEPFSVSLDGNGHGSFTPDPNGNGCSDYKICEALLIQ